MPSTKKYILNDAQSQAVNTTEGPVMVVAGPGTGKTQLLASRVQQILRNNQTLSPANILCLTFTEAGQVAMQRRLVEIMGEPGAHVAVHTFHSFGAEIISNHYDYFFNSVQFTPADELSTHEIITAVLDALPLRHPLATKHDDEYAHITSIKRRLQEFKKALTPEELQKVTVQGLAFVDYIEPYIIETFNVPTFTKKHILAASKLLEQALSYSDDMALPPSIRPLHSVFTESLAAAYMAADEAGAATPINNWKKDWFTKDADKKPVCKLRQTLEKLAEFAKIYQAYQDELHKRRLFDFDDMIMQVVQTLESRGDLLYELQEQYQYYLVDEFQDTNVAQMRLLHALANNPVNEGSPNIMVVGDDDQAIFAFQGAELSNILNFTDSFASAAQITLTENYRSSSPILAASRALIIQGKERLENYVSGLNKTLNPNAVFTAPTQLERQAFMSPEEEYSYVASNIMQQINAGTNPNDIAVIAREHKQLEALLPYLFDVGVPVAYERRENALVHPKIKELRLLAKVVHYISIQKPQLTNELMPELLSADYWQLAATDIWQLSINAHYSTNTSHSPGNNEASRLWLNHMLNGDNEKLKSIATFLLEAGKYAATHSLEQTLDILIGNNSAYVADSEDAEADNCDTQAQKLTVNSPFKDYYFSQHALKQSPDTYIELLSALTALRGSLRSYKPDAVHNLKDFLEFCELAEKAHITIPISLCHASGHQPIQLLTAHKSKGLEFDTVYILSATQSTWNGKPRASSIPLSPNLLVVAHAAQADDNLRLFYVAMTRAKRQLFISHSLVNESGKEVLPFAPLEDSTVSSIMPAPRGAKQPDDSMERRLIQAERSWQDKHLAIPSANLHDLLKNRLDNYALSSTHLNNFLDVPAGGPKKFFLHNLLQFPAAMSPSASFGSAMHSTLEFIHNTLLANGQLPALSDAEQFLESSLLRKSMQSTDLQKYDQQGRTALAAIYEQRSQNFTSSQLPEQDFRRQGVIINSAVLTGKLDVLDIAERRATVIDYKTGKGSQTWLDNGKSAYEKQKLHRYKQQLYFYKLLVDGSRTWGEKGIRAVQGELVFVEPNTKGQIDVLSLDLTDTDELNRLKALISAVWRCIMTLDFPDVSGYSPDVKGMITFEDWLIANK